MNLSPENLLLLSLLAPLCAAVLNGMVFRRSRFLAPALSCAAAAVALAASVSLLMSNPTPTAAHPLQANVPWFTLGNFKGNFGFLLDANAATTLLAVAFVMFCVHIFSVGVTGGGQPRGRFFAGLSFVLFSMLGIVLADNLVMLFFFWVLSGLGTYLIAAQHYETPEAAVAAKKAFLVNRIGDLGFLAGIALCYARYGTTDLSVLATIIDFGVEKSTAIGFFLLCAFVAKSSQFPLHIWLTDTIAASKPVAALVHATMTASAGIYLMVRVSFLLSPLVLDVMLWSCAAMAMAAAVCAVGQTDLKKCLAYASLSQLGFMGATIGLRLPEIAQMHLLAYIVLQGAVFLCAASVIHACHGEHDMTKMGGLLHRMPLTSRAFLVSGFMFPFGAGTIIAGVVFASALRNANFGVLALLLAAFFAFAFHMGRTWALVFLGKNAYAKMTAADANKTFFGKVFLRRNSGEPNSELAANAQEGNHWMLFPLLLCCIAAMGVFLYVMDCAVIGGYTTYLLEKSATLYALFAPFEMSKTFAATCSQVHGQLALTTPLVILIGSSGAFLAVWFYLKTPGDDALRVRAPRLHGLLKFRWCDAFYSAWIAKAQQPFANMIGFFDTLFINGFFVRCIGAGLPGLIGYASRRLLHTGSLQRQLLWFALGAAACAAVMLLW